MNDRYTILIIDDEEVVRDSCTHILAKGNFRIHTAEDGDRGLKMTEEFKPDLVFVDLKMPGLSGLEVLERINRFDPTIVTIVITGYATIISAVDAMKRGAYDFLPKPFSADEFRLITRRAVEKRKLLLDAITLRHEKEMLRENFTSIVSHELKSPLLAVQQNLYVILDGMVGELNPTQREMMERVKNRVDSLLRLINTWADMTSIDVSELKKRFKPLDIPSLVSKAVEVLQAQAVANNVTLVTDCARSVEPVNGDEGTLLEVFMNIIGNAIKFSERDNSVSIKIEGGDGELHVSVSDKGVGIQKEDIPFVFDDFYRGKVQARGAEMGSGLGLAISKRIINAHGGSITVESEPGKGSTFTVVLPRETGLSRTGGKEKTAGQFAT
jgi:signal transduction histidine kinase